MHTIVISLLCCSLFFIWPAVQKSCMKAPTVSGSICYCFIDCINLCLLHLFCCLLMPPSHLCLRISGFSTFLAAYAASLPSVHQITSHQGDGSGIRWQNPSLLIWLSLHRHPTWSKALLEKRSTAENLQEPLMALEFFLWHNFNNIRHFSENNYLCSRWVTI